MRAKSTDFRYISLAERTRWSLGQPLVRGEFTPARWHEEGVQPYVWPSWKAWAASYAAVRDQFLDFYYRRHGQDERPGSEHLYEVIRQGENPADVDMPRPPDPRQVLAGRPMHGIGRERR